jgi:hypothetical protein
MLVNEDPQAPSTQSARIYRSVDKSSHTDAKTVIGEIIDYQILLSNSVVGHPSKPPLAPYSRADLYIPLPSQSYQFSVSIVRRRYLRVSWTCGRMSEVYSRTRGKRDFEIGRYEYERRCITWKSETWVPGAPLRGRLVCLATYCRFNRILCGTFGSNEPDCIWVNRHHITWR